MSVSVITVYNKDPEQDYYCLDEFHASLVKFNEQAVVLGFRFPWGGLMSKPKYLKAYIGYDLCKTDHIIITDAWDVVFQQSPDEIIEKFKAFNCDWVAGAEENCFPESGMACDFPHTESRYKYLNSGFIVTTPDAMWEVLKSMNPESIPDDYTRPDGTRHEPNDQYYYQLEFIKQPVKMKLDYNCELVMNLCNAEESHLDLSFPIKNVITGTIPAAFHFNGPAKTNGLMPKIMQALKL